MFIAPNDAHQRTTCFAGGVEVSEQRGRESLIHSLIRFCRSDLDADPIIATPRSHDRHDVIEVDVTTRFRDYLSDALDICISTSSRLKPLEKLRDNLEQLSFGSVSGVALIRDVYAFDGVIHPHLCLSLNGSVTTPRTS